MAKQYLEHQNLKNSSNEIIQLGSDEGELVLDFFMGSATTQAVAHKNESPVYWY